MSQNQLYISNRFCDHMAPPFPGVFYKFATATASAFSVCPKDTSRNPNPRLDAAKFGRHPSPVPPLLLFLTSPRAARPFAVLSDPTPKLMAAAVPLRENGEQ